MSRSGEIAARAEPCSARNPSSRDWTRSTKRVLPATLLCYRRFCGLHLAMNQRVRATGCPGREGAGNMPLSEQEQRLLDEMERSLYHNDADDVTTVGARRGRPNYTAVALGILAGGFGSRASRGRRDHPPADRRHPRLRPDVHRRARGHRPAAPPDRFRDRVRRAAPSRAPGSWTRSTSGGNAATTSTRADARRSAREISRKGRLSRLFVVNGPSPSRRLITRPRTRMPSTLLPGHLLRPVVASGAILGA